MEEQAPQKKTLVTASFYVYSDNEHDLTQQIQTIKNLVEENHDGANMTVHAQTKL